MPFERFHRLPSDRRAALIAAAAEEFAREGFDGASLNRILARGGLSKGSYYFYFVDKEDLYATVFEAVTDELFAKLPPFDTKSLTAESYWRVLEENVDKWLEIVLAAPEVIALSRTMRPEHRASPRFAALIGRAEDRYRPFLEAGQRLGCVRTDLSMEEIFSLVRAIDAVVDERALRDPAGSTRAGLERHAAFALDVFERLLRPSSRERASAATPRRPPPRARARSPKGGRQGG